jgi:hypothetical protein
MSKACTAGWKLFQAPPPAPLIALKSLHMKTIITLATLLLSTTLLAEVMMKPLAESTCQNEYLDLFSKDEMTMTVVFGYDDLESKKTKDQYSLSLFVKTLTAKCGKWDQKMCGFKLKSINPHILTRKTFGPDGKVKTLKVITDASSLSDDDAQNRNNPAQKIQSQKMRDLFTSGLENSDVTFYHGHSRDGGGPSFAPPRLTSNGHVDYDWYHKNKSDKRLMVNALAKNPGKSRIVGLVSCSSIRWFSHSIGKSAPATGIVATNEAFYTSSFLESLPVMENIFSYQCLTSQKVDDAKKFAQLLGDKSFKVSAKNKNMSKEKMDSMTLAQLGNYLSSPDKSVRKEAYLEITSYDRKLYPKKLVQQLKDYSFGNVVGKNL